MEKKFGVLGSIKGHQGQELSRTQPYAMLLAWQNNPRAILMQSYQI